MFISRSLVLPSRILQRQASRVVFARAFANTASVNQGSTINSQKQPKDIPRQNINPAASSNKKAEILRPVTQPEKVEYRAGDLVRYQVGANITLGTVLALFSKPAVDDAGRTHAATPENPMAQIENYYTKNIVYHHLPALHWLARQEDAPAGLRDDASTTPAAAEKAQTHSPIKEVPESTLAEKKGDTSTMIDAEWSPLTIDFEPGDIVRYHVGRNITAGLVQEIYFSPLHVHGYYQHATRENPMARIENLWTKHVVYHHLNVLELVKKAEEVEPGRYAESHFQLGPEMETTAEHTTRTRGL